jgi:P22 tail accessory factor
MAYTKRQFVEAALTEIGLASYVFDIQPEQLEYARRRLDAMMADWNGKGIRLSYPIPASPEQGSLAEETNVPDSANEAIILNLAVRLAPSYGKQIMPDTRLLAKTAYDTVLQRATAPIELQFPDTLPSGAGNKYWRDADDPFMPTPVDPVETGPEGILEFN